MAGRQTQSVKFDLDVPLALSVERKRERANRGLIQRKGLCGLMAMMALGACRLGISQSAEDFWTSYQGVVAGISATCSLFADNPVAGRTFGITLMPSEGRANISFHLRTWHYARGSSVPVLIWVGDSVPIHTIAIGDDTVLLIEAVTLRSHEIATLLARKPTIHVEYPGTSIAPWYFVVKGDARVQEVKQAFLECAASSRR